MTSTRNSTKTVGWPVPRSWIPSGAELRWRRPDPGDLTAFDHAVYRVIEVNDSPADLWSEEQHAAVEAALSAGRMAPLPYVAVVRPVEITGDDPRARDRDLHLSSRGASGTTWWVYPNEHYPVCGTCQEPLPCREVLAVDEAAAAIAEMSRYESPDVCPACNQLVALGQHRRTFDVNLEIPGGPPITFHLRQKCFRAAYAYEMRYRREAPGATPKMCAGMLRQEACDHGPAGCDTADCPGPDVVHAVRRCVWCTPVRHRRTTTGTCRHCGRPIASDSDRSGLWVHTDTTLPRCAGTAATAIPRGLQP